VVQVAPGREQYGAALDVELAEVLSVFSWEGWDVGIRNDKAVPSSEDELTFAEVT